MYLKINALREAIKSIYHPFRGNFIYFHFYCLFLGFYIKIEDDCDIQLVIIQIWYGASEYHGKDCDTELKCLWLRGRDPPPHPPPPPQIYYLLLFWGRGGMWMLLLLQICLSNYGGISYESRKLLKIGNTSEHVYICSW